MFSSRPIVFASKALPLNVNAVLRAMTNEPVMRGRFGREAVCHAVYEIFLFGIATQIRRRAARQETNAADQRCPGKLGSPPACAGQRADNLPVARSRSSRRRLARPSTLRSEATDRRLIFDRQARPGGVHELRLRQRLAGAPQQRPKDQRDFLPYRHQFAAAQQCAVFEIEPKGLKGKALYGHRSLIVILGNVSGFFRRLFDTQTLPKSTIAHSRSKEPSGSQHGKRRCSRYISAWKSFHPATRAFPISRRKPAKLPISNSSSRRISADSGPADLTMLAGVSMGFVALCAFAPWPR